MFSGLGSRSRARESTGRDDVSNRHEHHLFLFSRVQTNSSTNCNQARVPLLNSYTWLSCLAEDYEFLSTLVVLRSDSKSTSLVQRTCEHVESATCGSSLRQILSYELRASKSPSLGSAIKLSKLLKLHKENWEAGKESNWALYHGRLMMWLSIRARRHVRCTAIDDYAVHYGSGEPAPCKSSLITSSRRQEL
jgi:hypothetical protein